MLYRDFIDNILKERGRFGVLDGVYHETHHIIPRCLGGSDEKDNLIELTAQEHFIAHKMLKEENPDNVKLSQAFGAMAFPRNPCEQRYQLTPEEYEEARIAVSKAFKAMYSDKTKHPSYGTHLSEERKKAIGDRNRGNKYCLGRKYSEETLEKFRRARQNISPETRKRMSEAQKRRNCTYGRNPRAKKVIRLSDGKIYDCIKSAAEDGGFVYATFKGRLDNGELDNYEFYNSDSQSQCLTNGCDDSYKSEEYFNAVYKEACELTAYVCKLYGIDPNGTVEFNGVTVPTILCHRDSHALELGSNHGDVMSWFKTFGKTMDDVRADVTKLLAPAPDYVEYIKTPEEAVKFANDCLNYGFEQTRENYIK